MRIWVLSTSTNNVECFLGSIQCIGNNDEVSTFFYDRRWHEAAMQAIQQNPSFGEQLRSGEGHIARERCAMDDDMLREAATFKPDVIVYISAWTGDFLPLNETLGELNQIAPMIHFLCDGQDPPWLAQLKEFERRGVFSLTVNIDGGHQWPGGKDWTGDWKIEKAITLLTPVDIRYFGPTPFTYEERPFAVGYAGNVGGHQRQALVERLNRIVGFKLKDRHNPETPYPWYADFLKHVRVSANTPFTGSYGQRHVKGRVLESGFAGCCLLEWANPATRAWFTPRHEFFEFSSIDEAGELAEWLAGHPKIAGETAAALQHRCHAEHTPAIFWKKCFELVGQA